jgi:hypothetical protein
MLVTVRVFDSSFSALIPPPRTTLHGTALAFPAYKDEECLQHYADSKIRIPEPH